VKILVAGSCKEPPATNAQVKEGFSGETSMNFTARDPKVPQGDLRTLIPDCFTRRLTASVPRNALCTASEVRSGTAAAALTSVLL
jgi:hypothetical protein